MSNGSQVKRLSKVAKEFNIGIHTIVEFLESKNIKIESNPNTKLDEGVYAVLLNEFQQDKNTKEESKKITIGSEKETISIKPIEKKIEEEKVEEKPEEPVVKEEPVQEEETKGPKIISKIDLDSINSKTRPDKKAKTAEKQEEKKEEPKKETPKEEKKEEEPKKEGPQSIETVYEKLNEIKVLRTIDLPVEKKFEKRKPVASSNKEKNVVDDDKSGNKSKRKRLSKKVDLSDAPRKFAKKGQQKGERVEKKQELTEKQIQDQVKETLARLTGGGKSKSVKHRKDKRLAASEEAQKNVEREEKEKSIIKITEFVTANELSKLMDVNVNEVIGACMSLGLFVSINQRLDAETISIIAEEFGYSVQFISASENLDFEQEEEDDPKDLLDRAPIVTVMGHVDHGKTSLLDYVRKANVIAGEAGGITQHIGAYSVTLDNGKRMAFLDTPGHEAFTAMRARGAQVTDIAIIVIAADDNIMPQTKEAINHAQAAGVPIVFAFNKIDKEGANVDRLREELSAMNILVEEWGGKYQTQEISAKFGTNVEELLEKVLLEAEMLELKANPNKKGRGTVIESELDKGKGYVSTLLVQSGTMKVGDVLLAGCYSGKVKAMFNERGTKITEAGPSTPVSLLGLNGAPSAGDKFYVMEDEREARNIAERRLQLVREQGARTNKHITLDEIGRRLAIGDFKELNVIIKGDVDGSIEALSDSLQKLSTDQIEVNIIHKSVGQISESDVMLAAASDAIIIGFQVRPSVNARKLAEQEQIDVRLYSIIYDAIEEIKDAMEGMLAPKFEEKITGTVEIREIFKISKVGTIAGCMVQEGKIYRTSDIRVIRDGIVVYTGKLGSLKRFKDDVKEVAKGYECGLNIDKFNDIKEGDIVEAYEQVEVKQKI
ncbi:MAG: translation initiation factor IF-2 [Vicingaceae bacterium]|jgi:translation initiation factor IF-2|nr:translation initiation factor IF-2 [Flavobacteriales bacterium]MBQ19216.1 translation initiation factor IF-2 [Flavobacteriales bacterium]MDF1676928.1 translation initiation factor IF-2 [Vicingaceae bacterium]|tara:strand:- start:66139 stop:68799 length:2661 start_codon:yes stop_codon:yes gene_type:complete